MTTTYDGFYLNDASTAKPWGAKELQVWKDMADTVTKDTIQAQKDVQGHKHAKIYDMAGTVIIDAYASGDPVQISESVNLPSGKNYMINNVPIGGSGIQGSGRAGFLPKMSDSTTITTSVIQDLSPSGGYINFNLTDSNDTTRPLSFMADSGGKVYIDASTGNHLQIDASNIYLNADKRVYLQATDNSSHLRAIYIDTTSSNYGTATIHTDSAGYGAGTLKLKAPMIQISPSSGYELIRAYDSHSLTFTATSQDSMEITADYNLATNQVCPLSIGAGTLNLNVADTSNFHGVHMATNSHTVAIQAGDPDALLVGDMRGATILFDRTVVITPEHGHGLTLSCAVSTNDVHIAVDRSLYIDATNDGNNSQVIISPYSAAWGAAAPIYLSADSAGNVSIGLDQDHVMTLGSGGDTTVSIDARLSIVNIPTDPSGLGTGSIWSSAGILMIV